MLGKERFEEEAEGEGGGAEGREISHLELASLVPIFNLRCGGGSFESSCALMGERRTITGCQIP